MSFPPSDSTVAKEPERFSEFDYELCSPDRDLLTGHAEEKLNRLRSLLAQWLRMENVVVLLGSGASKGCGGPLLNELEVDVLDGLDKLCSEDKTLLQAKPLIASRQATVRAGGTSKCSFEQWVSILANAASLGNIEKSPVSKIVFDGVGDLNNESLAHLVRMISLVIYVRCSLSLPKITERETGHAAFLAKVVSRDANLGRAHVFTTNYDTLVEQAAEDLRIHYCDGFVGNVRPRFDPSAYGLDVYYPGEVSQGRVRRYERFFHLHKLHGSIDWRRTDYSIVRARDCISTDWNEFKSKTPKQQLELLTAGFQHDGDPIGIIPTENKFVQTLGMPYSHIFRALHQRLQEPQTFLIVSGYGFQDPHINAVIDDAMANPGLVLLVVDPTKTEALVRRIGVYQKAGERAFLLTTAQTSSNRVATFDDFSINLLPNVKWIQDLIQLRRLERDISSLKQNDAERTTE